LAAQNSGEKPTKTVYLSNFNLWNFSLLLAWILHQIYQYFLGFKDNAICSE
jgi:hypothetical protein